MVQQKQHRYRASGSRDTLGVQSLGNDPSQWLTLRSSYDFEAPLQWDVMAREVGPLPSPGPRLGSGRRALRRSAS